MPWGQHKRQYKGVSRSTPAPRTERAERKCQLHHLLKSGLGQVLETETQFPHLKWR